MNWSRFHETMPLADMAKDPYAMSPTAMKTNVTSLTSTDGVNGPADISGAASLSVPASHLHERTCSLVLHATSPASVCFLFWLAITSSLRKCKRGPSFMSQHVYWGSGHGTRYC